MVNPSKNTGTAAETAIVRAARLRGFVNADRLTLTGRHDRGDVGLAPGVILEVKSGRAAETASDALIEAWLDQTETERVNAAAAVGILVTKRRGISPANAHRWWAHLRTAAFLELLGAPDGPAGRAPIRTCLEDILTVLRHAGYGEPLHAAPVHAVVPGQTSIGDYLEDIR